MSLRLLIALILVALILTISIYLKTKDNLNLYRVFSLFSVVLSFSSLMFIVIFIILKGVGHLSFDLFALEYTSDNLSMLPAIITTIIIVVLSVLLATPIGVFTAIYLVEYSKKNSKLVELIRICAETLQAIPSIVYGLFGMLFFVNKLNFGFSIFAGVFTLSIMILPLIIRTTEESLKAVDDNIRFASFALGAGRLRTIFKIVLPIAIPGILSAILLSVGRIVGESAALIFTLGTATAIPKNLFSSSRSLSVHMYMLSQEALNVGEAYASALVLMIIVLLINFFSNKLANKFVEVNIG